MNIQYPYLPQGRTIQYVPADNLFMRAARDFACANSLDKAQKTGSVVVKEDEVIGFGANGSKYHETHECERVKRGSRTGEDYELCEGCHPKNHSEPKAIQAARAGGYDTVNADLYLWGHWWLCEPCWKAVIGAGIANVYLLEGSEVSFDRANPGNVVGKQCEC